MARLPKQSESTTEQQQQQSIVATSSAVVAKQYRVARFRGRAMLLEPHPFEHYVPLTRERFNDIGYPLLGGVSRSRMSDVFAYLASTAEDLSPYENYILFGADRSRLHDPDLLIHATMHRPLIWDMHDCSWALSEKADSAIWRSPYAPIKPIPEADVERTRLQFVLDLAGGDEGLYDDIMQSLAPLVMDQKPDGVIWWVGDGANGKSTLMDAIYRVFPGQLASINVKRLTDGRDTPSLNGNLANVVKESSEGRIEDTEVYKNIGTHEDFRVHKFHSQDDTLIRGNMHHIFSANNIPVFNDKGHSARRRTFIVPFTQRFESDPTFEERTFTPEFFGQLVAEICYYAMRIKAQGFKYRFSAVTLNAKADYDSSANNAEEYARYMLESGVIAFDSYNSVKIDYENWCLDMGYVMLGMNHLRSAVRHMGYEPRSGTDVQGNVQTRNILRSMEGDDLQPLNDLRPGLLMSAGYSSSVPALPKFDQLPIPEVDQPVPTDTDDEPDETDTGAPAIPIKKTVVNNRW